MRRWIPAVAVAVILAPALAAQDTSSVVQVSLDEAVRRATAQPIACESG